MKKLAYKTKPVAQTVTIGNDKIGELEIPKLFGLTPNETELIDSLNLPDSLKQLAELARKIVTAKPKLNWLTVYKELKKFLDNGIEAVDESKAGFLETYLDEMTAFRIQYVKDANTAFYARALAILNCRLGSDFTIVDLENPAMIHPKLAIELAFFGSREESGVAEDEKTETKDATEVTEEALGESVAA